ncbi:SRPBCC family protein [Yoonia sp.]|uniref:SRPBCC family protein n=1 Tax=Yoonia sp. TaxID=2212373 RepID=UPI003919B5C2
MNMQTKGHSSSRADLWKLLAVGTAVAGGLLYLARPQQQAHPADDAPRHTTRRARFGDYAVTGRTVTIARPRAELYAFWREFTNLPRFMANVHSVDVDGDLTRWVIKGPANHNVTVETRIVQDRENEFISWRSTPQSQIDTEGSVRFREAPGNRGTQVEARIAYVPPGGEIGRWIAKAFLAEPALQGRQELKRLKMLMETGEIATNRNRNT